MQGTLGLSDHHMLHVENLALLVSAPPGKICLLG